METIKLIASIFTLFFTACALSFTLFKYILDKRIDGVYREITNNETNNEGEHKRLDNQHSECSKHCETCRTNCAIERKKDFERVYDKMKV
jgi:hypothetical protein